MGLYNLLTTSASGMSAQSALLNTVSDNIANVSTTGYKEATAEFSSLVLNSGSTSTYNSGSVLVDAQVQIDGQGGIEAGTSTSNLAISGSGYFIVKTSGGQQMLTRAGNFTVDTSGELVNAAGYTLQGYKTGATGVATLVPVNVSSSMLQANATSSAQLYVNLPSDTTVTTAGPTSLTAYDSLGAEVDLSATFTRTSAGVWGVQVSAPSGSVGTGALTFNTATGVLTSGSPIAISYTGASGSTMSFNLDMSQTTQLAKSYSVEKTYANGNAPSAVKDYTIDTDGTVSVTYENGSSKPVYTIPLATVASPDSMTVITGNAYIPNTKSGAIQVGVAGSGAFGDIKSNSLESSTVDLADELTTMIAAQNNYEANSKVFSTGSQLLQVLVNLGK